MDIDSDLVMGRNKQLRREENRKAQMEATAIALSDYARKLEILDEQSAKLMSRITSKQRTERIAALALHHIDSNGTNSDKYYTQFGRAFLEKDKAQVVSHLQNEKESASTDLPKLNGTLSHFEKLRKEQIAHITELKQQYKD